MSSKQTQTLGVAAYQKFLPLLELLHHKSKPVKCLLMKPVLDTSTTIGFMQFCSKTCTTCMILGQKAWAFMATIRQGLETTMFLHRQQGNHNAEAKLKRQGLRVKQPGGAHINS